MNDRPPDDARLEAWLRSDSEALPDDGFSARVLAALPPARPSFAWRRTLLVAAGAALGYALALAAGASVSGLAAAALDEMRRASADLADPWIAASAAATIGLLVYLWQDDEAGERPF